MEIHDEPLKWHDLSSICILPFLKHGDTMSTKADILKNLDRSRVLNDEKIKAMEKSAKERAKLFDEFLDERLEDENLVELYDDDVEEFMKKIVKSFKVALTKRKLLKEVEADIYLLSASTPFDYIKPLKEKQLKEIAKIRKEKGADAEEYLLENGYIDENGNLCDMRETYSTGTENPNFGLAYKQEHQFICSVIGVAHVPSDNTWYTINQTITGEGADNEISLICVRCKQACLSRVCENEMIDTQTRVMRKCGNTRPKFVWDRLALAVGMKLKGVIRTKTSGSGDDAKDVTEIALDKAFGAIYPIGYLPPEQQSKIDALSEKLDTVKDKDERKKIKALIKDIKNSVVTKEFLRKKLHELFPDDVFAKASEFEELSTTISAGEWKKGKFVIFEGYVVNIYTKVNTIKEMTILCNDDSFDINEQPDDFTGVRLNVSDVFYNINLKEKITEESDIIAVGQINKYKDYYPSLRCGGMIVMDVSKPENMIADVTSDFKTDYEQPEMSIGTIDDMDEEKDEPDEEPDEEPEDEPVEEEDDEPYEEELPVRKLKHKPADDKKLPTKHKEKSRMTNLDDLEID